MCTIPGKMNPERRHVSHGVIFFQVPLSRLAESKFPLAKPQLALLASAPKHVKSRLDIVIDIPTMEIADTMDWSDLHVLVEKLYMIPTKIAFEVENPLLDINFIFYPFCNYQPGLEEEHLTILANAETRTHGELFNWLARLAFQCLP